MVVNSFPKNVLIFIMVLNQLILNTCYTFIYSLTHLARDRDLYNIQTNGRNVHLCAGEGRVGASGVCQGDSGGPFVCECILQFFLHFSITRKLFSIDGFVFHSVIHLSGTLRKQTFTSTGSKGHVCGL